MVRKLSKKKISISKKSKNKNKHKNENKTKNRNRNRINLKGGTKKNKNKHKFNRLHKKNKRYQKHKGGSSNNNNNKELEETLRKVLREDQNISTTKTTKKKGMLKTIIGSLPFIGNLVQEPEEVTATQMQQEQNKEEQEKLQQEVEENKSGSNKKREKMVSNIKNTINEMTEKDESKSYSSMVGDSVRDSIRSRLGKTVETMAGTPKKIAETAAEIKKLATQRQCDAQFITNFGDLLNTCSREEMVEVYNKIATMIIQKKHFFSPRLEKEMEKLPILDYNPKKEQESIVKDVSSGATQDNKNTITKLQKNIEKKLRVAEKLKKLEGKKSKQKVINTKIDNAEQESQA